MKIKRSFIFSALMIAAFNVQAANQKLLLQQAGVQPIVAQPVAQKSDKVDAQHVTPEPVVQKKDLEQPVTDSVGLAIAAGAGAGVAWGLVDAIFARPSFQPSSPAGRMLLNGMRFISYFASLEVVRNYMEHTKKTRLPRFFLYATCITMNLVTVMSLYPPQVKVVYNAGMPIMVPILEPIAE